MVRLPSPERIMPCSVKVLPCWHAYLSILLPHLYCILYTAGVHISIRYTNMSHAMQAPLSRSAYVRM